MVSLLLSLALAQDCTPLPVDGARAVVPAGQVAFAAREPAPTGDSAEGLAALACTLEDHEGVAVVAVHSDSMGSGAYNLRLTQQRAEAVVAALVERGVPADRLQARGYGEVWPIDTNSTAEGRATNRRVELWLEPPEQHGGPGWTAPEPVEPSVPKPEPPSEPGPDGWCLDLREALAAGKGDSWTRSGALSEVVARTERCLADGWTLSRDGEALYGRRDGWSLAVEPGDAGPVVRVELR